MKYRVEVLGCKVNQYEAEQIKELLSGNGVEAGERRTADLILIHSCAVTAEAVRKLRQTIRRCAADAPRTRIIISGCAARAGIVDAELPDFSYIEPGRGWLARLASILPEVGCGRYEGGNLANDSLPLRRFSGHHRAFLKIQDGCDIACSYCIVPSLRGGSRDKPLADILAEARNLLAAGHREIVVAGVSVGLYGKQSGVALAEVIERLARIEGIERLRLSSLHPSDLTSELLAVWSSSRKIMPHIHLPLQSGSDSILKRMRRGYDSREFLAAAERARSSLDAPAISSDVIVGFPGETEADFADTEAVAREVGFSRMHIFPYSHRPGTLAASFRREGRAGDLKNRIRRLRELGEELRHEFHRSLVGRKTTALAETYDAETGIYRGYSERYVPVQFAGAAGKLGEVVELRLESATQSGMRGSAGLRS